MPCPVPCCLDRAGPWAPAAIPSEHPTTLGPPPRPAPHAQALGASERVFQLLDRVPHLAQSGRLKPEGAPEGGELRLEKVCFAYPSRPGAWVLQDLSLHVTPGQKVSCFPAVCLAFFLCVLVGGQPGLGDWGRERGRQRGEGPGGPSRCGFGDRAELPASTPQLPTPAPS